MSWLRTIASEGWGLFVDDGALAVAALVWLALCWLVLPRLGLGAIWLFPGLAAILLESATRGARSRRK